MQRSLIITGGSSGIGLAVAQRFADQDYRVFNLDISEGPIGKTLICDVTDHEAVVTCVNEIAEQGSIDVVVSNAGRHMSAAIEETSEQQFTDLFNLNVKGAFSLVKASVAHMKDQGGSIILIGSDQSSVGKPHSCAYNLSKHALASLAKTTALDYAPFNIRANIVCPGTIETPLYSHAVEAYCAQNGVDIAQVHAEEAALQPLGRIGQPSEVAAMVSFLASEDAEFITGAILPIDGGYTAQ